MAQRMKKEAIVTVRVLIDENGRVIDAKIPGKEAGFGFDTAALEAARRTSFKPATKNNVRVKIWVDLKVNFTLRQ